MKDTAGYLIDGSVTVNSTTGVQAYDGLAENLDTWLGDGGSSPDTFLLMIGTNDIGKGYKANATVRLEALIRSLYGYRPNAAVYLASLTPRPAFAAAINSFNAAIPGIVDGCLADGLDVHFVDMYTPLSANVSAYLSEDKLHPSAAGYNKIAEVWYNALTVPEPPATELVIAGLIVFGVWRSWQQRRKDWRNPTSRT